MNFLGIDVGTSAVKTVVVDGDQTVLAEASVPLAVRHPRPGWSEQDPEDWWRATEAAVADIRRTEARAFAGVGAVGLSGQMHGAVLLDAADAVIRPAILWNDGRATAECAELAAAVPDLGRIAGIVAMPAFTAPKLRWLAAHEPNAFARMRRVLLAKDYLRLRLTGEHATDMADAAGTLLLDEAARDWSDPILAAAGIGRSALPRLLEGSAPSGVLRPAISEAWGLRGPVTVAAGAGDAAAAAIGIGAVEDGDGFVSLGTSAQVFVTRDRYEPKPEALVHAFAHALPDRWFEMAAMLNGATCIDWAARLLGDGDVGALIERVEAGYGGPSPVVFLPYLSGERTPHNDPAARGVFAGLDQASGAVDLAQAVLEGVAYSIADGQRVLGEAAQGSTPLPLVGGGARSGFWMKLIAAILGRPLQRVAAADKGPAFGAARLARLAATGEAPASVCTKPEVIETVAPDAGLVEAYGERFANYRRLYPALRGRFG